jgi:hypothetical protein
MSNYDANTIAHVFRELIKLNEIATEIRGALKPSPAVEASDITDESLLFLNTLEPSPTVDSVRAAFKAVKAYRELDKVEAASAPEKPSPSEAKKPANPIADFVYDVLSNDTDGFWHVTLAFKKGETK